MWSLVKSAFGIKTEHTILNGVRYHGSTHRLWPDYRSKPHPTIETFRCVVNRASDSYTVLSGRIDATLQFLEKRRYCFWFCWSSRQEFRIDYRVIRSDSWDETSYPFCIALLVEPPLDITNLLMTDILQHLGSDSTEYEATITPTELNTFPFEV